MDLLNCCGGTVSVILGASFVILLALIWIIKRATSELSFHRNLQLVKKHVLIVGGSKGIGKCLAELCVQQGSNVTIVARDVVVLEQVKKELEYKCRHVDQKVSAFSADVSGDLEQLRGVYTQLVSKMGPVDVLINCAGFAVCGTFVELPAKDIQKLMQVNYMGSVLFTKLVVPDMISEKRAGQIVFVSSVAGLIGITGYSAYSATKFALRGLAESLAMELKAHNIGVSLAFPPDTDTPGFEQENRTKSDITKAISSCGGLFKPLQVAEAIMAGMQRRKFLVPCSFQGTVLVASGGGAGPPSSVWEVLVQAVLAVPVRLIVLNELRSSYRLVRADLESRSQRTKSE